MAQKVLTEAQKRNRFIKALTENGGEANAQEMCELLALPKAEVNTMARALVKDGLIVSAGGGKVALVPAEEEEVVAPVAKKAAVKVAAPAPAAKRRPVAPPVPDDDAEFDEEVVEDDPQEEIVADDDDGFGLDDDEGLDADGDEGFEDDEPATPAPKKGKKPSVTLAAPHVGFSMAFKPIDQLTDEELEERLEVGVSAAETLFEQSELVSELLMRSVAKIRRQINKRS